MEQAKYMHPSYMVSGLNAMDKTAMYEMPLIYVFGDWVMGLGRAFFCIGVFGNGILS